MLVDPALLRADQDDENLFMAFFDLYLAQDNNMFYRSIKLVNTKYFLVAVLDIAIDLKQLAPLKNNCGIKSQRTDSSLSKVKLW